MRTIWRAVTEIAFIMFMFYSNLLMGEFEHSGAGHSKGLLWALGDIFTADNFMIAAVTSLIGYALFEFIRKKL